MEKSIRKRGGDSTHMLIRPRINTLLARALEKRVACVVAGAGCGKTTAVKAFLPQSGVRNSWLQLTGLDNHPTRFWEGFVNAMQTLDGGLAQRMKRQGFPGSLEKTNRFLHQLADVCYREEQLVIVFDDRHLVTSNEVRGFISNLIAANIENLFFILISRQWPELEGLKAYPSEESVYITQDVLRFTLAETEQYLLQRGLDAAAEYSKRVQDATEGWPLAVCLVSLYAGKKSEPADFLDSPVPLVADLMERETFGHYPEEVRRALIKLSLLESFTREIAIIAGGEAANQVVEALRINMFVAHNLYTGIYTLQHLFLNFLKGKQELLGKKEKKQFLADAARWYFEHGDIIEAVSYYVACEEYDAAWDVMRQYSSFDDSYGKALFFYRLIDKFPPDFLERNPMIRVFQTHLHIIFADIGQAHERFLQLEKEFESLPKGKEKNSLLGETYIGLAHTSIIQRSWAFADYYKKAVACLPEGSVLIDRDQIYVGTSNAVFLFSPEEGELDRILKLLLEVMPATTEMMGGCGFGMEQLAAAEVYYMRGDLGKATEHAIRAADKAAQKEQHDIYCNAYMILMRVQFLKGNYPEAKDYLERIRAYAEVHHNYICNSILELAEGWFYIKIGRHEKVAAWILDDALSDKIHAPIEINSEKLVKAEYMLENKKYHELLGMLAGMEEFFIARGQFFLCLRARVIKAICYYRAGDLKNAAAALEQAYDMAAGNGLSIWFVEQGNNMRALLQAMKREKYCKIPAEWMNSIQTKASTFAKRQLYLANEYKKETKGAENVTDSLSAREKEVLRDICQALTREEIADNHGISVNTVKSILRSIYNKLGAINRSDAVRIAMDLWLSNTNDHRVK
ncbi:LuxR C-terminal-related transcriptional regulator [Christensenellaceae bacterium OttesenSCG-928-K19]|nr:LuxR C-terminal-related transcriptional regulator [Christensenellaceae bacterium OttesenSCG-928-K19]